MMEPLEKRVFRIKNPTMSFYCPLCRSQRALKVRPHLTKTHFMQVFLATLVFVIFAWPLFDWRGIFSFFFFWGVLEVTLRFYFKKEVPCPYCGFDATWYKRDVPRTRKIVKEFWEKREDDKVMDVKIPPEGSVENLEAQI